MRLWTLHPKYLDARGLVALWREALLAQKVLAGRTKGYRAHPQLHRFRAHPDPLEAIGAYLAAVHEEAVARGYRFDATRIARPGTARRIAETAGQLRYEREHLAAKLRVRDPARGRTLAKVGRLDPHPLFRLVAGGVREWEKGADGRPRRKVPPRAGSGAARRMGAERALGTVAASPADLDGNSRPLRNQRQTLRRSARRIPSGG